MLEQEPARKTTRRTTKSGGNGNADIAPAPCPAAAPVADLPPVPLTAYEQTALEAAAEVGVTPVTVIKGLLAEARGEGKDSTASTRVSAWEKLGKLLGMFDEKPEEYSPRILLG